MRKKSFYCLFIVALCAFVLQFVAACSDNRIVATISNKAALTAQWIVEDEDRSVELTFNPSSYNADNIETVVTSSNSNVVLASGTKLSAVGPGTATISVAVAGTITDSVEVSVKTRQSVTPLQSFSIENTSELATVSCGLTYDMQPSFTPAEIFTKDNTTPIVEFGKEGILSYEGGYKLKALSVGSTSVSVTVKDKTVKFNVAVEIGVPTLEFTPVANFNKETCTYNVLLQTGEQNKTLALPQVTAKSREGNDISDRIKVDTTVTVTDGTVTLGAGQHTINYSVTDPRDTTKIARKTLTLNVIGSTFAINPTYSTNGISMFTESVDKDGNVSATPARGIWSESDATFNMQASTLYYAETTFTYNVTSDLPMFGLAHYKTLNETIADGDPYNNAGELFGRRCIESVMTSNGKFMIKDLKPTDDHWYENYNSDNIYLNSSFKDNATFTTMKIAIARTADKMYTFVDGVLIKEFAVPADYSGATTPGIISCGAKDDFTVSNITVSSGADAQTKLDGLTKIETSTFRNNPVLSDGSTLYTENKDANGNIIVSSNKRGEFAATFNMGASTLYYAEATFSVTNTKNYPAFGLAHYLDLNEKVNNSADTFDAGSSLGRACVASIKSGTSATFLIGNLTAEIQRWHEAANTAAQLYKKGDFQANNFTQMKIAIARTADKMYTFVGDKLVQVDAPEGYKNVATTPGIITICDENKFTASNISLLSGDAAQAKINELTTATNA